jgi:DNA-binding PadR family transcriptional regulator
MYRQNNNSDRSFGHGFDPRFDGQSDPRMDFRGGFGRGRERFMRGHLNQIILEIIKEKPRHGYDIIKAIEEKFHGFYSPSAGSVYPILQTLEDQGFVTSSQDSGKKVYTITNDGENELKENKDKFSDMGEHLSERFRDMGRSRELMGEMNQTIHSVFGKLRERGATDPETMKKIRIAMVNFKTEVEEILRDQKERSKTTSG